MNSFGKFALLITRIYGFTFIAFGAGYALTALGLLIFTPHLRNLSIGYLVTAVAHLLGGGLIVALSRPIARLSSSFT